MCIRDRLTVHWFNPVLWAAYVLLGRDMENACDERVLRTLDGAGRADRHFLRELVFRNPESRQVLEGLIHPLLHQECLAQMQAARQNAAVSGLVIDVPLFFETSARYHQDAVCVVAVSRETQKARLALRNGFREDMIEAILAAQHPIMEKVAKADFVIWNEGPPSLLRQQTQRFYQHFFHD